MSRSVSIAVLARGINRQKVARSLYPLLHLRTFILRGDANVRKFEQRYGNRNTFRYSEMDIRALPKFQTGGHLTTREKIDILLATLAQAKECKETIYGSLDAWVAFEEVFPLGQLRTVLRSLERQEQWHRVIQVIKWMLSKGQGRTMDTFGQLIYALHMDNRGKEAHEIWRRRIGHKLHSAPRPLCSLMISIYYRNNMPEDLVKLFKGLEAIDCKPTDKSIVEKVADAYEKLGLLDEKKRVMEKYKGLFDESYIIKERTLETLCRYRRPERTQPKRATVSTLETLLKYRRPGDRLR